MLRHVFIVLLTCSLFLVVSSAAKSHAEDWLRFRGPNGAGVSAEKHEMPVEWSETKNLKWKLPLPGPGSSSPIIVGDKIFVTYWTGYGLDQREPGDPKDLKRHLMCVNRETGKQVWDKPVDAVLPEESYRGMFAENGYCSHTPVSDGKHVFVFFGKSGVLAFDMEGNQLWQKSVGTNDDPKHWGSASSPILYKDLVIVTAATEDNAILALKKDTGEEVWKQTAEGLTGTWGTPILVKVDDKRTDLVLGVPYEIWAFNPETGKLRWYSESLQSSSMCSSVVAHEGVIYAVGGREGGSVAVRGGGKGDVSDTHVIWQGRDRARIGTPVVFNHRLHWVSSGTANAIKLADGKRAYQERLSRPPSASSAPASSQTADQTRGGGRSRGGFGGRGGGRGGSDYASPVLADGKLYFTTRGGNVYVTQVAGEFKELAVNRFESDNGDFSATPAISNGELFIRSSKNLYCVAKTK